MRYSILFLILVAAADAKTEFDKDISQSFLNGVSSALGVYQFEAFKSFADIWNNL